MTNKLARTTQAYDTVTARTTQAYDTITVRTAQAYDAVTARTTQAYDTVTVRSGRAGGPKASSTRWQTADKTVHACTPAATGATLRDLAGLFVDGGEEEVVSGVEASRPHDVVLPARVDGIQMRHVQDLVCRRTEDERHLHHCHPVERE